MISRRTFLRVAASSGAFGLGTGLYTWLVEPHWLEIVRRPLPIRGLPSGLDGAVLAHLSDMHVGPRVSDEYVLETFRRVSALRPDIVAYTGDFTSFHDGVFAHVERIYDEGPRGRIATVGILGNHDYGPGWNRPEVAERLSAILQKRGVHVLRNEIADVEGLQIVGLDELWAGRFEPERAFAPLDPEGAYLALTHNPDSVDRPGWEGFEGWILAGHTHGGQCKPPFLPPPILPVDNRRYTSGEFDLSGGRSLYISRGIGHLLKVRFNVRPEVTLFELARRGGSDSTKY